MNVIIANKYQSQLGTLDIDVIKSLSGEFEVEEIISNFKNFYFNKMILDITAIKNYKDINNIQKLSVGLDMSKIILFLDEENSSPVFLSQLVSMGIYNFTRDLPNIKYLINNPNSYKDVAQFQKLAENANNDNNDNNSQANQGPIKTRIIGLKNVTENAGSTTLTYILKKYLEKAYKVMAIEMDKKDFLLFNDQELVSTDEEDFPTTIIKGKDRDVILIDLNNSAEIKDCDEVLYLVEPSIIKLNKIMRKNKNTFTELKGKTIVLNKSLISDKDVKEFEYEAKSKVFFNMPPLNDKTFDNHVVEDFLIKLGFDRLQTDVKPKRFKWFK